MAVYLKEPELAAELIRSRQLGRPTTELSKMFQLLATRLSRMNVYKNPMDRQDCIATAVSICLQKYEKWDPAKGTSCFSYYTTTVINGLREGWNQVAGHRKFTVSIDQVFDEGI